MWPQHNSCKYLEPTFKSIGAYINELGLHIAHHCDGYIQAKLGSRGLGQSLESTLSSSKAAKGRLLHYFPQLCDASSTDSTADGDALWCGYHNDLCTITGLLAGEYFNFDTGEPLGNIDDAEAGLYVVPDGADEPQRVSIPRDCIAFQIGESAQIVSGGLLRATAHGVRMPAGRKNLSRTTFALFLQPNPWDDLAIPQCGKEAIERALRTSNYVPSLEDGRYENGDKFYDFANKTIQAYNS